MRRFPSTASLRRAWIALFLLVCLLPAQEREPVEVYRSRREALRGKLTDGLIVLFGRSDDFGPDALLPFRQENSFYYLTGYDYPGAVLLLAPPVENRRSPFWEESSRLPREILFLPPRDRDQEHWTGPKPDPYIPEASAQTGVAVVKGIEALEAEIRRYAQGFPNLYTLRPDTHSEETESVFARDNAEKLRTILPFAKLRDPRSALAGLRQVKSEGELKLIRKAVECSMDAHLEAMRETRPGIFEYEISALMQYTFGRAGCTRPAYGPIVGSGTRSTILHYNRNSERMESGDLVVFDVAGEYAHYAADITRTLPVNGRFTPRQREIYEIVLGAQKAAINAVKPGMSLGRRDSDSLYQIAYNYINTHGKDLHGQPLGQYWLHGLGHMVGIDVHDPANYPAVLKPGMMFSIEPGVYIPEEKLGIRIECVFMVGQDGKLIDMDAELAHTADEIEAAMRGK